MRPKLHYLSNSDIESIHECSLKILNELGMKFPAKEALEAFNKAGAKIIDNDTVLINESLVNDALGKTRKRKDLTLYALNPENDVTFETHDPGITCMTMATSVIDPWSGEKRPATYEDLERLVRIADHLKHIKLSGGLVTPRM